MSSARDRFLAGALSPNSAVGWVLHDFHKHTAEALPALLRRLKAGGYKVVKMIPKAPVQTLPQYDEELLKDAKLPTVSERPVSSVVQTISQ